jgi:hypothetical protein
MDRRSISSAEWRGLAAPTRISDVTENHLGNQLAIVPKAQFPPDARLEGKRSPAQLGFRAKPALVRRSVREKNSAARVRRP